MKLWRRFKDVLVRRVLGLNDTPHRIAWGVFLGFLIAMTPTLGFQLLIYVGVAALLRANKVSGVPFLFISNPFTAAPLYYFVWWVGSLVLHGGVEAEGRGLVAQRLDAVEREAEDADIWTDVWTEEFWVGVGQTLIDMGAELWMGALVVGGISGAVGYLSARIGVVSYRRMRGRST